MPDSLSVSQDGTFQTPNPTIQADVLGSANRAFQVARFSIFALIALVLASVGMGAVEAILDRRIFISIFVPPPTDDPLFYLLGKHILHICLVVVAIIATIVGYKLTTAAGARVDVVIPPQDYPLLAPLVAEGKTESIDQYVRLSSLSGFTGTFTQLGLTGLPLATIFMTLFFTLLTLVKDDPFIDLTKLTLGAFLGSFVQRQVEQRGANRANDQTKAPAGT
ncbi:MAG: hypothetical protein H2042_11945 [Rhizobiales bacterium]|nr:hypothetical protein [Hyphomicrobiales bacterium]